MAQSFLMKVNMMPETMFAFSGYATNAPQLKLDVDRVKASLMNVEVSDIFATFQNNFGSRYVNDVNFDGQVNQAVVQADGTVGHVAVLQTPGRGLGFEEAAMEAVRRWRYRPGMQNGRPVAVRFTVLMDFILE